MKNKLIVIFFVLLFFLILYAIGFRITYSPELENSWPAFDAISGWVSAIAAVVAVIVAIVIANRQNEIANQQNEIARRQIDISAQQNNISLFEKRFEFYEILQSCISFNDLVKKDNDLESIKCSFINSFEKEKFVDLTKYMHESNSRLSRAIDVYEYIYRVFSKAEFLFDFETREYTWPLMNPLLEIITINDIDENKFFQDIYSKNIERLTIELYPKVKTALRQK